MIKPKTCKKCGNQMLWISWSSLRTHSECKQKGHLHRQKKRASLNDVRNFFPGTITDRVVRDWLEDDPTEKQGAMPSMVDAVMEREEQNIAEGRGVLKWRDATDKARVREECITAVTKIEPVLNKFVVPFDYKADYSFKVPMAVPHPAGGTEKILLTGFMDIYVQDHDGNYWVFDVKHTKDNGYWRKTRGQLTFYDLAVFIEQGKQTKGTALFQPLCSEPVKGFRISEESKSQMIGRISEMAWDIWSEDHTPRSDTSMCGFCDVKHACSKFKPTMSKGKRLAPML